MTLEVADYPRKRFGKVAEINGITSDDGPWISVREAFDITGLKSGVLLRWEEEGLISVVQDAERSQRRYLKRELEIVAEVGDDGPTNLRTLRDYVKARSDAPGVAGPPSSRAADTRQENTPEPDGSEGAVFLATLANLLRGQKLSPELVGECRLRVIRDAGSRGVAIECRRRASDGDRWWFSWGGGVWLCEADNPTEAVVQVKAALRTIGAP
ncbi:MerR family transcriptional regulator [Actinomadura violacea]|uniref:HTH merR-type domain-containing protein n=1 Tax=Actinomadura violacea TaxID=2819934 RepID=A0ABS3S9S5_9ACTN|nr:MerR family transcriptional regulator [Actinomadura violacea]MBO2465763.1 hypothetical protein [Actinomadura violacea]